MIEGNEKSWVHTLACPNGRGGMDKGSAILEYPWRASDR